MHSLAPESIRQEVEDSLRRLRVDVIDLYQIHWPSMPRQSADVEALEAAWRCLAEIRESGKVRHIGVCNFDTTELDRIGGIASVSSLQPPYSMLMRGIEAEILPYCESQGIGVIVYSPMQSGLLTGTMTRERIAALPDSDWRKGSTHFQEPSLSRNLALVDVIRLLGERHGRSPGEIAIAWTLRHAVVTGAIVGSRRPEQVEGTIGAAEFRLSAAELEEIASALPPSVGLF